MCGGRVSHAADEDRRRSPPAAGPFRFRVAVDVLWPVIRPFRPLIGMRGLRRGRLVFRAECGPVIRRRTVIRWRRRTVSLRRRGTVPRIVIVVGTIDAAACQQKRRHEQRKKQYPFHVPSRWMAVPIQNNTGRSTRQALRHERAARGGNSRRGEGR